jgi:hypothetical protein
MSQHNGTARFVEGVIAPPAIDKAQLAVLYESGFGKRYG